MKYLSKRIKQADYLKVVPVSDEEKALARDIEQDVKSLIRVLEDAYNRLQNVGYRLSAKALYNKIVFGVDEEKVTDEQAKAFISFTLSLRDRAKEINNLSRSIALKLRNLGNNDKVQTLSDMVLDKNHILQQAISDFSDRVSDAKRNDQFFVTIKEFIAKFLAPDLKSFSEIILGKNILSFLREDVGGLDNNVVY
jgi:hypothetical protein